MSKLVDALGSIGSLFRLGIGGSQLRSNAGTIEARDATNAAYASLRSNDLIINGSRHSVSSTAPSSPAVGDRWLETSSGFPIYGWDWCWDGTYWRSPDREFLTSETSLTTAGANKSFLADSTFSGYFFKYFSTDFSVATLNDATSYWQITLYRVSASGAVTGVANATTLANGVATYVENKSTLNTHVSIAGTGVKVFSFFSYKMGSTATPGALSGSTKVVYNVVR